MTFATSAITYFKLKVVRDKKQNKANSSYHMVTKQKVLFTYTKFHLI
jgi:hypothetical protein